MHLKPVELIHFRGWRAVAVIYIDVALNRISGAITMASLPSSKPSPSS